MDRSKNLKTFEIYYVENGELLRFVCQAEDSHHALEQYKDANPNNNKIIGLRPIKAG